MEIRKLGEQDANALVSFISETYDEYPLAMWFDVKPSKEEIESIFRNKLDGMEDEGLVDLVAEESGTIAGECELVGVEEDIGVIGIIIRKSYSRKGLGTDLLEKTIALGETIGISKIVVEVLENNIPALAFFKSNGFIHAASRPIEKNGKMQNLIMLERV